MYKRQGRDKVMRIITVKGTGNVSARPDYIILSLNIEVLSETYDRAMSEAAERIERQMCIRDSHCTGTCWNWFLHTLENTLS